jgi:hypothetical protein
MATISLEYVSTVNVSGYVKELQDKIRKGLDQAILDIRFQIRKRTAEGDDIDGSKMAEYKPSYRKVRAKAGRNVTPVDLFLSGDMINNMFTHINDLKSTELQGIISFVESGSPTALQKALWAMEGDSRITKSGEPYRYPRKFFGLSPEQEVYIHNKIEKAVKG